jgi:hypothetical protein
MELNIALVGAGMFGGDVHARTYADLQRSGIAPHLGRIGLAIGLVILRPSNSGL